jgi:hypothetical protein
MIESFLIHLIFYFSALQEVFVPWLHKSAVQKADKLYTTSRSLLDGKKYDLHMW